MKRFFVLLVVAVVGCDGAYRDHGDGPDGGMDDVTCGSVTCDQIPAPSCEGSTLHEYTASCSAGTCSYPPTDTDCGAAGCCGDHCCEAEASNASETGALMQTGLVIAANGTFNTDTECESSALLGTCTIVARVGLPEACVCRSDELTVDSLEIKGRRALVLLVSKSVRIDSVLDVSGDYAEPGPGAMTATYPYGNGQSGGVGGSFATQGAGTVNSVTPIASTYGNATLVPLHGGSSGQSASQLSSVRGGGGGGALQITAGQRIEVVGAIYAGGGGGIAGFNSQSYSGGSGGGSGGAILLEAPSVVMTGSLNANGGGGGGGGGQSKAGENGHDANTGTALGGQGDDGGGCALQGYTHGGDGGNGATSSSEPGIGGRLHYISGCLDVAYVGGGGGGGGLGRIRINTLGGCNCTGVVSPNATFGMLGVR
jgi:hypothetical protein